MLQKSVTELKEEIDRLEKQYVFSTNETKRLTDVLFEKNFDYETLTKKLSSFKKELAVTDRKYHAAKNRIAFLQKVIPSLEHDLKHINFEFHESDKEIQELKSRKAVLEETLYNLRQLNNQLSTTLAEKESENNHILSDIKAAEREKKVNLNAISELLSKTSQEHFNSEKELDQLWIDLMKMSGERETIKSEFNKKRQRVNELTEKSARLESTHAELTETVALEKSLKTLETSVQILETDSKTEEDGVLLLEKELSEGKRTLEVLSTNNIVNRDSLSNLANEVKPYDELALTVQASEAKLKESEKSLEKATLDLQTNFRNHIQLKKKFYLQPNSHI